MFCTMEYIWERSFGKWRWIFRAEFFLEEIDDIASDDGSYCIKNVSIFLPCIILSLVCNITKSSWFYISMYVMTRDINFSK